MELDQGGILDDSYQLAYFFDLLREVCCNFPLSFKVFVSFLGWTINSSSPFSLNDFE